MEEQCTVVFASIVMEPASECAWRGAIPPLPPLAGSVTYYAKTCIVVSRFLHSYERRNNSWERERAGRSWILLWTGILWAVDEEGRAAVDEEGRAAVDEEGRAVAAAQDAVAVHPSGTVRRHWTNNLDNEAFNIQQAYFIQKIQYCGSGSDSMGFLDPDWHSESRRV